MTATEVERPPTGDDEAPSRLVTLLKSKQTEASVSVLVFVLIFVVYAIWLGAAFTSVDGRLLDLHQNTPVLLLGLAVLVTLVAGQFDLSVASMATLTAFLVIGLPVLHDWPFWLTLLACLGVGLVTGLVNGLLVVGLGVNTFIATLGTGAILLGFSQVFSKNSAIPGDDSLPSWFTGRGSLGEFGHKFPSWILWIGLVIVALLAFRALRNARPVRTPDNTWTLVSAGIVAVVALLLIFGADLPAIVEGVSWTIALLIAVAIALWVVMNMTTFGRSVLATGAHTEAARLAGIKTGRQTVIAFVVGASLAALAGVMIGANQGTATSNVAAGYLLPAFGAVFLSTVIFSTGRFTVFGTVVGGIFLVWVAQGLVVGGVPSQWTDVINGSMLVLAVAGSTLMRRYGSR